MIFTQQAQMKAEYHKEESTYLEAGRKYHSVYETCTLSGEHNHKQVTEYLEKGFTQGGSRVYMDSSYEEIYLWKATRTEIKEPELIDIEFDPDDCSCHIVAPCAGCEYKSINHEE